MKYQFKCSAAAMQGAAHKMEGIPCQDKVAKLRENKVCCVALADGAGSRPGSGHGAELACSRTTELLVNGFGHYWAMDVGCLTESLLADILEPFRDETPFIEDLSTTLLFFACHEDGRFLSGHIGDGAIIWVDAQGAYVFSPPENGEFINETYFLTGDDAYGHFRIKKGTLGQPGTVLMMSDGISKSLLRISDMETAPACATIAGWIQQWDEGTMDLIYENNLKQVYASRSNDDLSLASVSWEEAL